MYSLRFVGCYIFAIALIVGLTAYEQQFFKPSGVFLLYEGSKEGTTIRELLDRKAKVSGILFLGKDGRYFFQATREQHGFFEFPNFVHGNFSYRHNKKYPFAGYLDMEADGTGLKFTLSYKKPLPGPHLHLESKDSGVALTVHSSEFLNTELKEYLPKGD